MPTQNSLALAASNDPWYSEEAAQQLAPNIANKGFGAISTSPSQFEGYDAAMDKIAARVKADRENRGMPPEEDSKEFYRVQTGEGKPSAMWGGQAISSEAQETLRKKFGDNWAASAPAEEIKNVLRTMDMQKFYYDQAIEASMQGMGVPSGGDVASALMDRIVGATGLDRTMLAPYLGQLSNKLKTMGANSMMTRDQVAAQLNNLPQSVVQEHGRRFAIKRQQEANPELFQRQLEERKMRVAETEAGAKKMTAEADMEKATKPEGELTPKFIVEEWGKFHKDRTELISKKMDPLGGGMDYEHAAEATDKEMESRKNKLERDEASMYISHMTQEEKIRYQNKVKSMEAEAEKQAKREEKAFETDEQKPETFSSAMKNLASQNAEEEAAKTILTPVAGEERKQIVGSITDAGIKKSLGAIDTELDPLRKSINDVISRREAFHAKKIEDYGTLLEKLEAATVKVDALIKDSSGVDKSALATYLSRIETELKKLKSLYPGISGSPRRIAELVIKEREMESKPRAETTYYPGMQ